MVILQQGLSIFAGAWGDLTDAGVSERTRAALARTLEPLLAPPPDSATAAHPNGAAAVPQLLAVRDLRARRAGSRLFVDLTADVAGVLSVRDAAALDAAIARTLRAARKEVAEVRVKFEPVPAHEQ